MNVDDKSIKTILLVSVQVRMELNKLYYEHNGRTIEDIVRLIPELDIQSSAFGIFSNPNLPAEIKRRFVLLDHVSPFSEEEKVYIAMANLDADNNV